VSYAVKVAWGYGKRRRYGLEPGSLSESISDAAAHAERLNADRKSNPQKYLDGFKAYVVWVADFEVPE
jgi:hypothetical protein